MQTRSALFWGIAWGVLAIFGKYFGPIFKSQGPSPLKMGQIGCPEKSVKNHQYTLRNIPGERKSFKVQFEVTRHNGRCNADRSIVTHISANYSNTRRTDESSGSTVSRWVMKAAEQRHTGRSIMYSGSTKIYYNKKIQFLPYGRSIGSWICLTYKTYTCHTVQNTYSASMAFSDSQ
jgi:hypothetical protein